MPEQQTRACGWLAEAQLHLLLALLARLSVTRSAPCPSHSQLLFNMCLLLSQGTGLAAVQTAVEMVVGSVVGGGFGMAGELLGVGGWNWHPCVASRSDGSGGTSCEPTCAVSYIALAAGGGVYEPSVARAACLMCLVSGDHVSCHVWASMAGVMNASGHCLMSDVVWTREWAYCVPCRRAPGCSSPPLVASASPGTGWPSPSARQGAAGCSAAMDSQPVEWH